MRQPMLNLSRLFSCEEMTYIEKQDVLHDWKLPPNTLVHASHCHNDHGCKYLDRDCPVATGRVKELYPYDPEHD